MKIDILTLFPNMFRGPFDESIIRRAQDKKLVEIKIHNLRKWTKDKRKTVDDKPYGGGIGMVLMVEPIFKAIKSLKTQNSKSSVILLSPQGIVFNQKKAQELAKSDHLILICGHYEGFDERIRKHLVDEEISIGNYILTGGELPAMVVADSVTRLIPGVLKKPEAVQLESFSKLKIRKLKIENLLEYPQYTRPANFKGWKVPSILLSGNPKKIKEWQEKKAIEKTQKREAKLNSI